MTCPEAVRDQIEFVLVDTVDEVLEAALLPAEDDRPRADETSDDREERTRIATTATRRRARNERRDDRRTRVVTNS